MSRSRFLLACVLLVTFIGAVHAQIPEWNWAQKVGGTSVEESGQIAIDSSGNCYVIGHYTGNISFTANITLTGTTLYDVFVAKYNSQGECQWAVKAGGTTGDEFGNSIALDSTGENVYITGGYKSNPCTFGSYSLARYDTNNSKSDIYVAKLSSSGVFAWASRAGSVGNADEGKGISVDGSGNVFVTGNYKGTSTFGTISAVSAGSDDIFVAKLSNAGAWTWAKSAGGAASDIGYCIDTDSSGNIYVGSGFASITATYGIGHVLSNYNTYGGSHDIAISKLNINGTWQWTTKAGGTGTDLPYSIFTEADGTTYVSGSFTLLSAFGTTSLANSGAFDLFAAKISSSGDWDWATKGGGSGNDNGWAIYHGADGNTYVGGEFIGVCSFGTITISSTSSITSDGFLALLDDEGTWVWVKRIGGTSTDLCSSIGLNSSGEPYAFGNFTGTAYFDGIPLSSYGANKDIYLGKLLGAPLKLLSPQGGENWINGSTHNITWYANGVEQVVIEYKVGVDTLWTAITPNPISASPGSYSWQLPGITSTEVTVRIRDYADANVFSVSNPFRIYVPLTLLSLQGGEDEVYAYNTTQTVLWDAELVSQVLLEYSTNAGNSWTPIVSTPVPANQEAYNWVIPYETSETTKVRVRDFANPSVVAESQSVFVIYIPLVLQTLQGGAGIIYAGDSVQDIVWTHNFVNEVMLDYSLDGGSTWLPITQTPLAAALGTYAWQLPNVDCDTAKVRVRDFSNPQFFALSSNVFGIRRPLTQLSLLGGAGMEFAAMTPVIVQWTSFSVQQVSLDYSVDSGANWIPMTANPVDASQGFYQWLLPSITSHTARVRISDYANPNTYVSSPQDFAILVPPSVPEEVQGGTDAENPENFQISWTAVLTDVNGQPIQPEGYHIYYSTVLSNDLEDFTLLATVTDGNTFVHEGVTQQLGNVFYKVVAFRH